jgi:hypothetical protein
VPGRTDGKPPPTPLRRNAAGIGLLAALVGVFGAFVWVAGRNVADGRGGGGGEGLGRAAGRVETTAGPAETDHRESHGEGRSIRGSMSLSEVAGTCGITVETARGRLGLPPEVPADERLGRLSARYGFSIPEARERLAGARPDR